MDSRLKSQTIRFRLPVLFYKNACSTEIIDVFVIFISSFLLLLVLYFALLRNTLPNLMVKKYVHSLCIEDYSSAILLFNDTPDGLYGGDEAVMHALEDRYGGAERIDIISMDTTADDTCTVLLDIKGKYGHFEDVVMVVDIDEGPGMFERDWRIAFPFMVQDLKISGVEGSTVLVDGSEAGHIKDGMLDINNIISSKHDFLSRIDSIGESEHVTIELGKNTAEIDLKINPYKEFMSSIEKLVYDFCSGWSKYCMSQDPSFIKQYLTDDMFQMYKKDTEIFGGSRYLICDGSAEIQGLEIEDIKSITCTVYEEWHTKEAITDRRLVFSENKKSELERLQYITWKYRIINEDGQWKIDSTENIEFRQDILN